MSKKMRFGRTGLLAALVFGLMTAYAADKMGGKPLPAPDGKPAEMSKPVQVFIMMGQSNMFGMGRVEPQEKQGTLLHAVKEKGRYQHLIDDQGNWTQRKDVRYVQVMHRRGSMRQLHNEWLTIKGGKIGPEVQFGHIMGHELEKPVLLLKSCIGNRSLGWDLLPPGSERFEHGDRVYAGYKETPSSWPKGTDPKKPKHNWYAGKQYDDDVANAKKVLENLDKYYPGTKDYEVAGFVWWQGHKDQNPAHASRYEHNLVNLIEALRKDFNAPDAKFVLATIGFGGEKLSGPGKTIAEAQLAVDGDTGKYPNFKGNVAAIDSRPLWRDKSASPSGAGYHYNHNAETYMDVGNALGRAMADLLEK